MAKVSIRALLLSLFIYLPVSLQAQTKGIDPSNIDGLILWLDATDIDGNPATPNPQPGSQVQFWADKSGRGTGAFSTGETLPIVRNNVLGVGLDSISFNAQNLNQLQTELGLPFGAGEIMMAAKVAPNSFTTATSQPLLEQGPFSVVFDREGGLSVGGSDAQRAKLEEGSTYLFNLAREEGESQAGFLVSQALGEDIAEDLGDVRWISSEDPLTIGSGFSGDIGAILAFDRVLTEEERKGALEYMVGSYFFPNFFDAVPGDFDEDGNITPDDINILTNRLLYPNPEDPNSPCLQPNPPRWCIFASDPTQAQLDVNGDGIFDGADHTFFIKEVAGTFFGDANLDFQFNTSDLVQILAAGKFESDEFASYEEGDFNGDGKFNTSDLVAALGDGGFEQGIAGQTNLVPEPTSVTALLLMFVATICYSRRRSR